MAEAALHINGARYQPPIFQGSNLRRPFSSSPQASYRPMRLSLPTTTTTTNTTTTTTTNNNNQSYWASINETIEAHLKQTIQIKDPLVVFEPMHKLTFSTPRTSASAICIAACELVGGHRSQALPTAAALHLIHAATSAHDHLLSTHGPLNRAKVHHGFTPDIILLTGDGMLPLSFELITGSDDLSGNFSGRILRVMVEVAHSVRAAGVVEGQYEEVVAVQQNKSEDMALCGEKCWVKRVLEKKYGRLHGCGAACGAILGGGDEEVIEKLRKYGVYVGMIHGITCRWKGRMEERVTLELVQDLRELALKELEDFRGAHVEAISSLVNV